VHNSVDTTQAKRAGGVIPFCGAGIFSCCRLYGSGNWATDIAGGSKYGYSLIWVLLMSNLIAILLQTLSARLVSSEGA